MDRPIPLGATDPDLDRAAELLRAGRLVAFPTETVYGLGARADEDEAVRRIFEAKGRRSSNPLIVHVADVESAAELAVTFPPTARRLAERFWPGPLTLVLPRRPGAVSELVTAGGETIGVRVPSSDVALALLRRVGLPIAAPSANRSLAVSPTTAAHVRASLGDRVEAIIDGGPCDVGLESTVLDLTTSPPMVLRLGGLTLARLREVLPEAGAGASEVEEQGARSPGRERRHYAPSVPLWLVSRGAGDERTTQLRASGATISLVTFGRGGDLDLGGDPRDAARRLYAALRELEGACDGIVVEAPAVGDEWAAIRDRLSRAGA